MLFNNCELSDLLCTVNMKLSMVILYLILAFSQTSQEIGNSFGATINEHFDCIKDSSCPTWFTCNSQNSCECGDEHNYAVVCDARRKESAVLDTYCVTYDRKSKSTYLGQCFYNCQNGDKKNKLDSVYSRLPQNPEDLFNESACTPFHRTGLLCGDCEEGYSPYVLSYNLSCVKCPDGHKNWWRFILAGFVSLTFFYFFVVIFHINVTSSRLHGVVWFSQALSFPALTRSLMNELSLGHSPHTLIASKTFLVFYSFWNLDLFRSIIPDICLNVTTLQALALDYLIALYPFVLILLSYILIELHDRRFTVIVIIWKPIHNVLSAFRKSWDIRTSVIDSFATFFLLSYVKVLSVTSDLLIPTEVYKLGSDKTQPELRLYYSPTVQYFGDEHLPYAITAIVIVTLLVSVPTMILILYPFKFFQRFLSIFPFNWHFLHAFVDSFQGWYKDGTEPGTFDCRWFSAFTLLSRLLLIIIHGMALSTIFFIYGIVMLLAFSIIITNIQPFKMVASRNPSTDVTFFILLGLVFTAVLARDVAILGKFLSITFTLIFGFLTAFVPIIYTASLISFWMISRIRWLRYEWHKNYDYDTAP